MICKKIKPLGLFILVFLLSFSTIAYAASNVKVTKVSLNKSKVTLTVGESTTLKATVLPTNATNKKVNWKSSNSQVASVKNGKITGLKTGTVTITVTTADSGKTAICKVTVIDPIVRFKDKVLESEIRKLIGLPSGNITQSKLSKITTLSLSDKNISDISGLEYCKKLTKLDLSSNLISDITPLIKLTGLKVLNLDGNPILEEDLKSLVKALNSCEIQGPSYNSVIDIN